LDSEDEAEDGEIRHLRAQRIIDSAGQVVFVNKYQALLAGVNTMVFMRTVNPIDERREKYPAAFVLGPLQDNANVYLEPNYIFKSAMERSRLQRLRWVWETLSREEVGVLGHLRGC